MGSAKIIRLTNAMKRFQSCGKYTVFLAFKSASMYDNPQRIKAAFLLSLTMAADNRINQSNPSSDREGRTL